MNARVLVVDDNPLDRRVTSQAVARLGHQPEPVEDGDAALNMLTDDQGLDLVLLDLIMPGTDGFAVLRAMRDDPRLRHLPVIVVSAADAMDDVVRSIELGATDHLTKPLRAPLLEARLTASLAGKRLRDIELDHLVQVQRVIDAAVGLQHGTRGLSMLDPVIERSDDLGTLARVFRQMAMDVHAREDALRQQVASLRIDVDRARIGNHVAEVTGTDHYQTLAEQAAGLRRIITDGKEGGTGDR